MRGDSECWIAASEAKDVLLDPYALTREYPDVVGEQRFVTLGMGGMVGF